MANTPDISANPSTRRINAKYVLWSVLFLAAVWVFVSNEVALMIDYPMFHEFRVQMIMDRALLIPHATFGVFALIVGALQFSTRLRQRRPRLHRLMGRSYVIAVYCAGLTAIAINWNRPLLPATATQAAVWILTTTVAWMLARNGHFQIHRQWVARSYAVTFSFFTLRLLSIWPKYWNLPDSASMLVIVCAVLASVLVADIITNWREIAS